jgi:Na+-transporting NADH:ubiquinone oxidoreductase subunit C
MTHIRSVLYMFVITLVFASGVSGVKELNEERITRNQDLKLRRVILKVMDIKKPPGLDDADVVEFFDKRVKTVTHEGRPVYVGYSDDGQAISGYAVPVGGAGVWGSIDGMLGITPDGKQLTGLAFYKHSETPGLGGRISEPWFQNQFKGLKLHEVSGDEKIFNLVPSGTSSKDNDLDAITGATLTTAAVETFLNDELNFFLTKLWGPLKEAK